MTGSDAKYIDGSQEWFAAVKGFLPRVKCSHSGDNKVTMSMIAAFALWSVWNNWSRDGLLVTG